MLQCAWNNFGTSFKLQKGCYFEYAIHEETETEINFPKTKQLKRKLHNELPVYTVN